MNQEVAYIQITPRTEEGERVYRFTWMGDESWPVYVSFELEATPDWKDQVSKMPWKLERVGENKEERYGIYRRANGPS